MLRFYKWKTNAKLKAGAKISQIYKYGLCQQSKIFSNMKYFALSKNRANIQMHRQQLQLPCQSRKCSYSWFCMADWVGIFLQVELIYGECATRSLHWFVNSYIWNCIYYRYYIIQISYHKYYTKKLLSKCYWSQGAHAFFGHFLLTQSKQNQGLPSHVHGKIWPRHTQFWLR